MGWFSFLKSAASAVPTPSAGKVAIFVDSTTGVPNYKGEDGVAHTLKGDPGAGSLTNPMTTVGDLIVGGTAGAPGRLAAGTDDYVLTSNGPGVAPSWQPSAGGGGSGVPSVNGITSAVTIANGSGISVATVGSTVTISAMGGSSTVPWKDFVADFGADPTGATDCGTAWDAAMTYAVANGGLKLLCVGTFLCSRARQHTSAENAQLPLPSLNYVGTDVPITIEIVGREAPNPVVSLIGGQPAPGAGATVFKSTLSSGTGNLMAAFHSGSFNNISNIHVVLRDIIFQTVDNPTNSAVNLEHAATCEVDGVFIYTGNMTLSSVTYPTTSSSYGLKTPMNGNGANTVLGTADVVGFYNGYSIAEHTIGKNVKAWGCVNPFVFIAADHASAFHRLMSVHCTNGLVAPASGAHVTRIFQYDVEHAAPGTFANVTDIKDTANTLFGDVSWRVVAESIGGDTTWTVNGAQNFRYSSNNVISKVRTTSGTTDTFKITDEDGLVSCADSVPLTFTIPPESSVPWHDGATLTAIVTGTGVVTIAAGAGVTINGLNGFTSRGQYDVLTARKVGINTWNVTASPSVLTNPMTTAGDMIYGGASGAPTRLPQGTAEYALVTRSGAPAWADVKGVAQTVANANTAIAAIHRGGMLTRSNADTTARTYTIPANASVPLEVGHITTIVNDGASGNISIAITTDSLFWSPAGTTGTRTLAPKGIATIVKVASNRWYISGAGLT